MKTLIVLAVLAWTLSGMAGNAANPDAIELEPMPRPVEMSSDMDAPVPFDEKTGTIPHTDGRIEGSRSEYVVGWIKRGPSGVIGSNKKDSQATVDTLLRDLRARDLREFGPDHRDEVAAWLLTRQPKLVTGEHWRLIDSHERSAGQTLGRPRVKLASVAELLRVGHG